MGEERFFLVTTGRSGSSLLAAIIAASGGRFGLPAVNNWDASNGALEHREFGQASALLAKAHQLSEVRPPDPYRALFWTVYRHSAKRLLRQALSEATFVKSGDTDLCLPMAIQLSFAPRVIVSYRRPEGQIASQYVRGKYQSIDYLLERYVRVMRNALGAVRTLGGCVVSYDDLHDRSADAWAYALGELAGLDPEALLRHRADLVRPEPRDETRLCLSQEAERLWREAEDLRGMVFNATRPAVRMQSVFREPSGPDSLKLLENIENNPICTVRFDRSVPCIRVTWKGYATSAQIRHVHEEILGLLKRYGVGKILGDDTVMPIIHAEDQRWIAEEWMPRALAVGLRAAATKRPLQYFGKVSIDRIQSEAPSGLEIQSFDSIEDACSWLKSVHI